MRNALVAAALTIGGVVGGCDAPEDARTSWLQSTLVADNLPFALRSPALVAGKFAKMASDPYAFLRGTAAQFARDLAEPGGAAHLGTRFASADAARVLLVGDPHPENLGTFGSGEAPLALDFNDFDAARYGPYHQDVWRLALGFRIACDRAAGSADADCDAVAHAVAAGYADTILGIADGAPAARVSADDPAVGALAGDLFSRAARDGAARADLDAVVVGTDGAPGFAQGVLEEPTVPGVIAAELVSLTTDEAAVVAAVLGRYPTSLAPADRPPGWARVKDTARRLGSGVASYPLWRFYVLVEGPTADPDDDAVLEIREVWDPLRLGGLRTVPPVPFADNGARVVGAQRLLQGAPALDPQLGWGALGQHAFRVRDKTAFQKGFSVDRLARLFARGDADLQDLAAFAALAGRILAADHARAPLLGGGDAATAIGATLRIDPAGFAGEAEAFARHYAAVVYADYARMTALLTRAGPLLGFTP